MAKKRLDVLLFEKGLCPSRERAKTAIMEGIVYIAGQKAGKAGDMVDENAELEVRGNENAFVSMAARRSRRRSTHFNIDPTNLVVMDDGASTNGFTDCLRCAAVRKVYSMTSAMSAGWRGVCVGIRVSSAWSTNIRYVTPDMLESRRRSASSTCRSFPQSWVLPVVSSLLTEDGHVANLIKPQFEAGKGKVGKKGVVREPEIHLEVLQNYVENAHAAGFKVLDVTFSPIKGPEGNIEFLGYLAKQGEEHIPDLAEVVRQAHEELDAKA